LPEIELGAYIEREHHRPRSGGRNQRYPPEHCRYASSLSDVATDVVECGAVQVHSLKREIVKTPIRRLCIFFQRIQGGERERPEILILTSSSSAVALHLGRGGGFTHSRTDDLEEEGFAEGCLVDGKDFVQEHGDGLSRWIALEYRRDRVPPELHPHVTHCDVAHLAVDAGDVDVEGTDDDVGISCSGMLERREEVGGVVVLTGIC